MNQRILGLKLRESALLEEYREPLKWLYEQVCLTELAERLLSWNICLVSQTTDVHASFGFSTVRLPT